MDVTIIGKSLLTPADQSRMASDYAADLSDAGYICSRIEWTLNNPMSQIATATPNVSPISCTGLGNAASSGKPGGTYRRKINLLLAGVHSRCLDRR